MKHPIARRLTQIGGLVLIQVLCLFPAAGRWDWGAAWIHLGLYLAFIAYNAILILPRGGRELMEERSRIGENAKGWDKLVGGLSVLFGPAGLVIAGLDERFGWGNGISLGVRVGAGAVIVLGYLLFGWAMASNKFFSAIVRIQSDRGHTVQTGGPYRFVRHPAYVGMILSGLGLPVMLDSCWALIPAGMMTIMVIIRTALEDRTLRNELDGYTTYAGRVRWRLLPGIW